MKLIEYFTFWLTIIGFPEGSTSSTRGQHQQHQRTAPEGSTHPNFSYFAPNDVTVDEHKSFKYVSEMLQVLIASSDGGVQRYYPAQNTL